MKQPQTHKTSYAFTLAELLIALAILGVIATFTIPKVLQAQQNSQSNAEAKEAFSIVASAFQQYKLEHGLSSTVSAPDLTPYLNYVKVQTTGTIDSVPTFTNRICKSTEPCLILHNGGALSASPNQFSGTDTTNFIDFFFDPDATYSGSVNDSPSKAVQIIIYYDGRITSAKNRLTGSVSGGTSFNPVPDPSWFSWN